MFSYDRIADGFHKVFEENKDRMGADEKGFLVLPGKNKDGSSDIYASYFEYPKFSIEILYIPSTSMYTQKSILETRIFLEKREKRFFFSPYELTYPVFGGKRKNWLYPYIESEDRMEKCASSLFSDLLSVLPDIEKASDDFDYTSRLYSETKTYINKVFGEDVFDDSKDDYSDEMLELKIAYITAWKNGIYSSKPFTDILKGKNTKDANALRSVSNIPDFIETMFFENAEKNLSNYAVKPETDTVSDFNSFISKEKSLPKYFLSALFLTPAVFILLSVFYTVLLKVAFKDSLFITNSGFGSLVSLIFPAFILSAFLSHMGIKILILLFSKNKSQKLAYYEISSVGARFGFIKAASHVATVITIVLVALIACRNIAFYDDMLIDNTDLFSLKGDKIYYSDIERIYEIVDEPENEEKIVIPSYVISGKNGYELALSDYASVSFIKKDVLPLLKEKEIEFKENITTEEYENLKDSE